VTGSGVTEESTLLPPSALLGAAGVDLRYRVSGTGAAVLALHAGIADSRMWWPQFAGMREGCRIVAPDMPGYGGTPVPAGTFETSALLDALLAELHIDGYWLWGVSFGARLALERAIALPAGVRGMVVVSPLLDRFAETPAIESFERAEEEHLAAGDLEAATELNLRMWVSGPARRIEDMPPGITGRLRAMQLDVFRAQAAGPAQAAPCGFDVAERAAEPDMPVLIVHGDLDHACVRQSAEHLAARMRRATLWTAHGAAHLPSVELPRQFRQRVLDFMAGREQG
jgi:3-oxoadipate enol-lactonase